MLRMLNSSGISFAQSNYPFAPLLGVSKRGRSAAIAVGNVRHDYICGIDHPSVPLRNGVPQWDAFQRWIDRIVIELCVMVSIQVCQDQRRAYVWIYGLQVTDGHGSHRIKSAVATQQKGICTLRDQVTQYKSQLSG